MYRVTENPEFFKMEICALGHPLSDCPARRGGCNNHWAMLNFMMPPWRVRDLAVEALGDDPGVQEWIAHLEAVLPGDAATRENWP